MMFAHVENGALVRFLAELPFTFKGVRRIPSLTSIERAALGLLPVVDQTPPIDPLVSRLAKLPLAVSVFSDRVVIVRQTELIPAPDIAKREAYDALRNDQRAVELRDKLQAASPAEISAYVDAQVTDLASARIMFKRVLLMLALLSR